MQAFLNEIHLIISYARLPNRVQIPTNLFLYQKRRQSISHTQRTQLKANIWNSTRSKIHSIRATLCVRNFAESSVLLLESLVMAPTNATFKKYRNLIHTHHLIPKNFSSLSFQHETFSPRDLIQHINRSFQFSLFHSMLLLLLPWAFETRARL